MITLEEFTDRALDTPFLEKGRSYDGWDCWGLIKVAYQDVLGIDLPDYTGGYTSTRRRDELQQLIDVQKQGEWTLADPHAPLDVAIVRMMGRNCHTGLMLDGWNMLHVQNQVCAIIEPIDCAPWKSVNYDKVEGVYRHVER